MRRILSVPLLLCIVSAFIALFTFPVGCAKADASISFADADFEDISQVILYNCHNGSTM